MKKGLCLGLFAVIVCAMAVYAEGQGLGEKANTVAGNVQKSADNTSAAVVATSTGVAQKAEMQIKNAEKKAEKAEKKAAKKVKKAEKKSEKKAEKIADVKKDVAASTTTVVETVAVAASTSATVVK